jgi:hypothetical protein
MTQAPEYRSTDQIDRSANSTHARVQQIAITVALTLLLVALWLLEHRYSGFNGDGQIYAFQALARTHPALAADLYLQNTSQDQFTIFSPLYSSFINLFGLENAAVLLFVLFTVWFFVATWILAGTLFGRATAWLAVALLIITVGDYGAFGVFRFSETFLTARLPAEALVVTALACYFRGFKLLGFLLAAAALLIHPLMALPGLLLLLCVSLSYRLSLIGAAAGILVALGIALAGIAMPTAASILTVLDAPWLEVVRERSQFLFLQLWSPGDWELNARPFVCLAITAASIEDAQMRKLALGAMLVGATGLAVAFIASLIGPVAILIQGQAWRWVWVTGFVSVLLLVPTALRLWRDDTCGPICSILLVSGWTISAIDGTACTSVALILWSVRSHISERSARYFRWGAVALAVMILIWVLANSWTIVSSAPAESGREPLLLGKIRNIIGLEISAVMLFGLLWHWIRSSRTLHMPAAVSVALLVSFVFVLPASFKQIRWVDQISSVGSPSEIAEFADWRRAIPQTGTVLVTNGHDLGSFVWFTLERSNYLSVGQSAGAVFSRKTALEIRRRSNVLLPIMDPGWKLLTFIRERASARGKRKSSESPFRPLTAKSLVSVCSDPQLGFVISPDSVGFDPVRHTRAGAWKNWNLYDCEHVRSLAPAI